MKQMRRLKDTTFQLDGSLHILKISLTFFELLLTLVYSESYFPATHDLLVNFRKLLSKVATWDGSTFESYFPVDAWASDQLSKVTCPSCHVGRANFRKILSKVATWDDRSFESNFRRWQKVKKSSGKVKKS